MLARVLLSMLICMGSLAQAEEPQPDVFLVQLNTPSLPEWDSLLDDRWQREEGSCLAIPGRAAIQTALLFGTPPLQQGVVSDLDWRRKSVKGETIAHMYAKNGYHTQFYGAWTQGAAAPFDPKSRGFDQSVYFEAATKDTLSDQWGFSSALPEFIFEKRNSNKPVFTFIAEGRYLSQEVIISQLKKCLSESKSPALLMILETRNTQGNEYHYPAKWHYLSTQKTEYQPKIETVWEIAFPPEAKPEFTFFHKANWPAAESPERHRHRGSLVLGKGLALVDGLRLFPAKDSAPDLTQEMDIEEHQDAHEALLTAHSQWWQTASRALHNARAFDVGGKDNVAVKLTAQDWRPSKIISPEGKSPSSVPLIYQADLLAMLEGLKTKPEYKETFPAYSGSWAVNIARAGRYKITASLLPKHVKDPKQKALMKLEGGTANIKLGSSTSQLNLLKGASVISIQMDADAGVTDLECWFTGQLPLTRELGAFFVEIERVGDKKFDLKAKAAE